MRALAIVLALEAIAHADPVRVHAEVAVTGEGGGDVTSVAFRGYLGVTLQQPGQGARGFLGAGAHVGAGALEVRDPRATDNYLELSFETVGPEARLGVVFVDGGYVDTQLYVAAAQLTAGVDRRLMYDHVAGIHGGSGWRVAVGATYADRLYRAFLRSIEDPDDRGADPLLFLVPVAFEITREDSAGSTRTGVSFGWGF